MNRAVLFLAGLITLPAIGLAVAYVEPMTVPADGQQVPAPITVQTCFEPENNCAAVVVRALGLAEATAMTGAYALTEPSIIQALVDAKRRGVDVELIVDKGVPCERHSGVPAVVAAGIPVWVDSKVRLAHWKTIVIDGHLVVAGSFNFSVAASHNSEDLVTIDSPDVAAQFANHWRARRDASTPYQLREDWCPVGTGMVR